MEDSGASSFRFHFLHNNYFNDIIRDRELVLGINMLY